MKHFLFEEKEYRFNPKFKRLKKEKDSAQALAVLIRRLTPRVKKSGKATSSSKFIIVRVDARQKCVVKMQYSNSGRAHRVQLEHYLVREGTELDGSRARLYGTDLDDYKTNMTDRNFRIFLSPQSDRVNLADLAKDFIKTLERQTGYKFYWQAANHYNTAHPHAHLLINGKDQNGVEVEIPRDIVKTFMREYARDICTSQIGNRTREEMAVEKERELESRRFTRIDGYIKELCGDSNRLRPSRISSNYDRVLVRLENLRGMGFCSYENGEYHLAPQWEENLRANGRYNTFLSARAQLKYSNQENFNVFSGGSGIVTGKVTKVYRTDDDVSDNHAVIIEALDGKAYFVPLFKQPVLHDGKTKTALKEGELVSIKTYESQKGRLTPVIFKRDARDLIKVIKNNNISGLLADEIKVSGRGIYNDRRTEK
jgi:hypothetical protein